MLAISLNRFDAKFVRNGHFKAIWSLKLPGVNPRWDEYLVCLYSLTNLDDGAPIVRYREDVTHEVVVVSLAPSVRLDFDIDVFGQSKLIPITPANHAWQFAAETDEMAVARLSDVVTGLLRGTLPPDEDPDNLWAEQFKDGVRLTS
ncbi:hypothetical protein [Hyphomicrobium sp. ghe19]|uniref:hypothetical protein n=1 Tax=Hyphomicrobium sp. ghe19 TaxID=2682968 RepID=UPI00136772B9|nr:hypothetical protein HYPP_02542 [Hyphomicrobium sp. ghe19]